MQVDARDADVHFPLLQLPGPALGLALQRLDTCSLAKAAMTCSVLSKQLRLVVMDLHLVHRVATSVGVVYQSVTYVSGNAAFHNCALGLSYDEHSWGTIICKQVMAQDEGIMYFVPYSNSIRRGCVGAVQVSRAAVIAATCDAMYTYLLLGCTSLGLWQACCKAGASWWR